MLVRNGVRLRGEARYRGVAELHGEVRHREASGLHGEARYPEVAGCGVKMLVGGSWGLHGDEVAGFS